MSARSLEKGLVLTNPYREGQAMKWMLVVLVGGVTPVNTDLVFDKFSECLAAEEQMRQHYIDAFEAWDRSAAVSADRRRDYRRARDMQAKRLLGDVGTCIPHADGSQPQIVTPSTARRATNFAANAAA